MNGDAYHYPEPTVLRIPFFVELLPFVASIMPVLKTSIDAKRKKVFYNSLIHTGRHFSRWNSGQSGCFGTCRYLRAKRIAERYTRRIA